MPIYNESLGDVAERIKARKEAPSPQAPAKGEESAAVQAVEKKPVLRKTEVVANFLAPYSKHILEFYGGDARLAQNFTRTVITEVANDAELLKSVYECPQSLAGAILTAAQMKLMPNTPLGECFLLPCKYFNARHESVRRVKFQLGYQGALKLTYRSGEVLYVRAEAVYEKDFFKAQYGTSESLVHIPYDGPEPGEVVRYYAIIKLKNGSSLFKTWRKDKVVAHAKEFSNSWDGREFTGAWRTNFDAMAYKTVFLDVMKYAPKETELALQLAQDGSVKSVSDGYNAFNVDCLANEEYTMQQAEQDGEKEKEAEESSLPSSEIGDAGDGEKPTLEELGKQFGFKKGSDLKPVRRRRKVSEDNNQENGEITITQ